MNTKIIFLFAALLVSEVISRPSYSHGFSGEHTHSQDDHDHLRYHGPTAIPHVLHDGHIADTHEVAAAKAEHYAAVAKANLHGGYGGGDYGSGHGYGYGGINGYSHGQEHLYSHDVHDHLKYQGPTAIPHVLHDGHIADTNEVAVAKAEHLAAVSKAKAYGEYGQVYSGQYASGNGGHHEYTHHPAPYHGPLAKPVVLKSGYLADTHEVAAAKEHHLHTLHSTSSHGHGHYHH